MVKFKNIVFSSNYGVRFKLVIDFILLVFVYSLVEYIFKLNYSSIYSPLYFSLLSIFSIFIFGGYNIIFRYISIEDIFKLVFAILISTLIFSILNYWFKNIFNLDIISLFFFSSTALILFRVFIKKYFSKVKNNDNTLTKILIFAAGQNGIITKRAFYNNSNFDIVGFVDDDHNKIGKIIDGIKIYQINNKLSQLIRKNNISKVVIATKKITFNRKKIINKFFSSNNVQVLDLPPVQSWIDGIPDISNLREIKIDELLSRGTIQINNKKNKLNYQGKSILVTGAAGSIGSEIIKQLLKFSPEEIILFDNAETPMFKIKNQLKSFEKNVKFVFYVDSVVDEKAVKKVFDSHEIDFVFHAAAYKHVGMMEENPRVAVLNNVFGTKLIIDYSLLYHVKRFVLISSDKAVNPTNVMGATKRISELYLDFKNENSKTKFVTTRFGNVLGSNGSVVPIFNSQIEKGGPITITDPKIERYFMTIPEASLLVLEAGTMAKGGEIFLFDMGKPIKIIELAKKMITQKGLIYDRDIKIEFTGLRSGEKLYEELLLASENLTKTYNKYIYIAKKLKINKESALLINQLIKTSFDNEDDMKIVALIKEIVPEYISNNSKYQILDKNVEANI